jgi:DnaJ-class molecular chaperone
MFKDYYIILDIGQNASELDIRKAFREQANKWHPDKNNSEDAHEMFIQIHEAYLLLKDKEARERYDIEYNKFKQYQEQTKSTKSNQYKSDSSKFSSQSTNTKYQSETNEYKVDDDLLAKWMSNAKRQAVDIANQAVKDLKGVSGAAANGCVKGLSQALIWVIVLNVIFFIVKACGN